MDYEKAPINVLKAGTDPKLLPNDAYPPWLSGIATEQPTLRELKEKEQLTYPEMSRLVNLMNRQHIKAENTKRQKNK